MKINSFFLIFTALVSFFVIVSCDNTGDPPVIKNPGIYIKVTDSRTGAALDSAIIRTCYSFSNPDSAPYDGDWTLSPNPASSVFEVYYEVKNDSEYKKIAFTDVNDKELNTLYEGVQKKGFYVVQINTANLGEQVDQKGFYYISCDTGALKTKKMIMIFDLPYIIDDSEFSLVVGTRLTDRSGDAFLPYDLYPLSESGIVIKKTSESGQKMGNFQFKKEAVIEIWKEKYKTQKITVPLNKDKVHEVNVKLEPRFIID